VIKTFIKGIVFGTGFSISVVIVLFIARELLIKELDLNYDIPDSSSAEWRDLSDDEELKKASAIALIRYSDTVSQDGSKNAFVEKVFTDKSIKLDFGPGDPYPSLRYYPKNNSFRERTGVLVIFRDSPPIEQHTLFLYDDRVAAYGDMPVDVAIIKFKEN
jgi:hypothetical protein